MKHNAFAVALGTASGIFGAAPLLPTTRAECVLTTDPCSTDANAEECCFAELGAICDTSSNGGSCCFPTKDHPDALCTQDNDCCGTLLCISGICSDVIEFTSDGIDFKILQTETEYGSGEYDFTSVTAQQDGTDPVLFELNANGDVTTISSNGDVQYPPPSSNFRHLRTPWKASSKRIQTESEAFSMIPRTSWDNSLTMGGETILEDKELGKRRLSETAEEICAAVAELICDISIGFACRSLAFQNALIQTTGGTICLALQGTVCTLGNNLAQACENIVDCEGDPHMRGLHGQKFDFSGQDGAWYATLHDELFSVNMRVTAPIADLDKITYITGLGVSITDASSVVRTVVLTVDSPLEMQSECPNVGEACLADGALTVELDGIKRTTPGEVPLGGGVFFSAANIPGECRPFGFEKYWQKKAAAQNTLVASDTRRLNIEPASLWILSDEHKTNPVECRAYVRRSMNEGTLFDHQSEHTSIQIRSGDLSIRVNHGKIHQVAMRDPSDRYDLPDHIAYQMNIEFERLNIGDNPQGVIGATAHITKDENGEDIMFGPDAIPGEEEDYRVSGPLYTHFDAFTS